MTSSPGRGFRVAGGLAAIVFALSAAVQHNDPDPLPWMALYAAAAVLGVVVALGQRGRGLSVAAAALGVLALGWLLTLAPSAARFVSTPRPEGLSYTMKAGDTLEEEAREAGGLLLVTLWSGAVVWSARRGKLRS